MDETEVGRIASWVGLDVGKEDHHATVVSAAGERLFELAVRNDEAAIGRLHWLEGSDETLERLRLLGGYDDDLAHDVNRTANRLRDMLLAIGPALERVLGPRLDHPVARALLARYPTPTALRAAGRRRLGPLCKRHAPRLGARLVDELRSALAAQTVAVPAEETAGRVIRELAEELDRLADRRDRLAAEIEQTFSGHPRAPVLLSIPGIGARTGARILTEIGESTDSPPGDTSPPTPASP